MSKHHRNISDYLWRAEEELDYKLREVRSNRWTERIFESKTAQRGGVVRRKASTIDKYSSRIELLDEVMRRGFHILAAGDQWLIFCNDNSTFRVIA